jgi:hypothetical protein
LIFLGLIMGTGIWKNRKVVSISGIPLSRIDQKTVVLKLK